MYGDWRILNKIGSGGNGDVHRCKGTDGTEAAIKVLRRDRNRHRDRIVRFRNEVRFLISHGCRPGVVPLLDHALPDDPAEPSWYVMPMAVPILEALGATPELSQAVQAVEHIARTLADLVAEGVSHRDIKPDNLFQLNGEWAVGDFGLVKYPEHESATRHGRPLGPYYFMAPEMRQNADTANAELADVYSLAKTLWAIAAGRADPPPGELRRDRTELQLSSHVEDRRANLLESLLERCTSDNPSGRPALHEIVEELSWWTEPNVPVQSDLSHYAREVTRLRHATNVAKKETERERLENLYREAYDRVHSTLTTHLLAAIEQAGLLILSGPRSPDGWVPENYGGGATSPCWGIEHLSSPWLAANIGVVHRTQPDEDLENLAVTVVLAMMTPDSQHNYIRELKHFKSGSLRLEQIIGELKTQLGRELPGIVAHFLTTYGQTRVPR